MKIGIAFANAGPFADPERSVGMARAAEQAGADSVWTVEHVVVPAGYESTYPYSRSGRMSGDDMPIPDPLVWLTWVAAHTSTILLGTGILILAQRSPFVTAKAVATLDVMSGGRVRLGVGIGWLREEFDVLGVPFEGRGRRTEEWIAAMRVLWGEDHPSFHGELLGFDDVLMYPKPLARRVPVVIGGHTESSARRAGRIGDGYFPGRGTPEEIGALVATMRATAAAAGRDPDVIEVTAGGRPSRELAERLAEVGVRRMTIAPPAYEVEAFGDAVARIAADLAGV